MITLSFTVPIADVVGWRIALVAWGGLVVVGMAVWWYATRAPVRMREPVQVNQSDDRGAGRVRDDRVWWRRPVVWGLTVGFSGQAFAYYGATAWLPLLLGDELGLAPGAAAASSSIFQIAALVGAFGVPVLLRVCPGPRTVILIVTAGWFTLPLGLLFALPLWPVWCGIAGAAQGGGLVVVFALVVSRSRNLAESRQMSALVQGGGYVVASTGPAVIGAVHEATGTWSVPLLVILTATVLFCVATTVSATRRTTARA
jgi:CP family cyanate transporter-like MFS transporter